MMIALAGAGGGGEVVYFFNLHEDFYLELCRSPLFGKPKRFWEIYI